MDEERVGFTFLPTHQDGTTISAFAFDRRIRRFERWRCFGHPFHERRCDDLEIFLLKGWHCCNAPLLVVVATCVLFPTLISTAG
jgi:hypothetical protein